MDAPSALEHYVPGQPHWWQWLTILSLDAPLVAVAWQSALARSARLPLQGYHGFILGAAVWLAYAADRWIEGWRLNPDQVRTQRHWFYQQWRWSVAAVWITVLASALRLAMVRLSRVEWDAGLLLLAPVLAYLLSHQLVHRTLSWRAPKEICVALLFVGGVACFPAARHPLAWPASLVPLGLFGLLCFTNCALISIWEDEVDRSHDQTSLALQFPRSRPYVRVLPWLIAVLSVAGAAWRSDGRTGIAWCAVSSGALLGFLDLLHDRLGRQLLRALADLALMTPYVWLLVAPA